ncbi:MAG TPA: M28 family peptidase [Acetobacteraceae bacterium]|nr:M28 family peptidase [Acetobacteraceae bacterium]
MPEPSPASFSASVDGAVLMRHMQGFARWIKLSGTDDEMQSLEAVRASLAGYGLSTTILRHDALISLPGRSRVAFGNATPPSITHSFSRSSPPEGVTAALVDVGEGTAAEFAAVDARGRIVLVDGIASPAIAHRAKAAGAIGQLHVSPHEHLHEMCVSPIWGSPSPLTVDALPATIVNTIAAADGAAIRASLASGASPQVTLFAEVDTGWRKTPILVAELYPADAPPDAPFVMFSGHHDTWYYGVMDNGGANATMLEVARLAALHRDALRRGLRLCFWSGHSHGRYSGSAWYADEHWAELDARCVAHINVDSTGGAGATVLANSAAMPELAPLVAEALAAEAGTNYVGRPMDRSSDQSFWGVGLPSALGTLSEQPPGPVKLRNRLGWWWHTPHDTLEHIDEANLVRDTRVFAHLLWRLLAAPLPPLDYTAWSAALVRELADLQRALGARLDLAPLIAAAEALGKAAARLASLPPARATALLTRLSRILVPLHTLSGDRFSHDPALPQPPWPPVASLRALAALPPASDEAFPAMVAARRARNRLAHALGEANRLLAQA